MTLGKSATLVHSVPVPFRAFDSLIGINQVGHQVFSNQKQHVNEFWRFSSRNRSGHESHPITLARRNLILELWAAGRTKGDIAEELGIDEHTVSRHFMEARKAGDARAVIRHPGTLRAMELAKC